MKTTTNQTRAEEEDIPSTAGSEALELSAYRITSPESSQRIRDALERHCDPFAAFLLGTDTHELAADTLVKTFEDSYVMTAGSEQLAFEGLALLTGLVDGYKARLQVEEGAAVTETTFLHRADDFRERVARNYVIVGFLSACYVFDARVIRNSANR